jgi:hypothetical protein
MFNDDDQLFGPKWNVKKFQKELRALDKARAR